MPNYLPTEIKLQLMQTYNELKDKGYDVYYISLYGSQNYGIETEHSDLDFKAIILPSLEDLVNQTKPVSCIYQYDWGQVEVKDIRNYVESAVKVNVNFIELLSTEYYYSPYDNANEFRGFFTSLLDEQGEIYLRACMGMIMQKAHALRHPYPSKMDVINKFGYDPKQLCHIIRLRMLMERYTKGNYDFHHDGYEKTYLTHIKTNGAEDDIDNIANENIKMSQDIIDAYKVKPTFETKYRMIQFSRDLIINNIKKNLGK